MVAPKSPELDAEIAVTKDHRLPSHISNTVPSTVHVCPPEEARTPGKDPRARDHKAPNHISKMVLTTAELSLHPYHEAKAGGVATPNNPRHSAHGPGSEEGRDEPQTAGKTTAGQRARPVHQVPPRTCRAKQDPLRAVPQKDPRIRSQERSRSQTGQVYRGVNLSHAHRAKKARRKLGLLFAVSHTVRRATIDHGPAGDKMTASIPWQPVYVQLWYTLG